MKKNKFKTTFSQSSLVEKIAPSVYSKKNSNSENLSNVVFRIGQDIEKLLNSRKPSIIRCEPYSELNQSLINYGIFNFVNYLSTTDKQQKLFCQKLANTISLFEPRLINISVFLLENDKEQINVLRIRIEAVICGQKEHHSILLESQLTTEKQLFTII